MSGLIEKAEAVFTEMRKNRITSSTLVYNAYIEGLIKGRNSKKALEIFQRMKKDRCQPSTDTYTMLINLYGKANQSTMALKVFHDMKSEKCIPNICTYTALINAFAREGLCEKAEQVFEELQEAEHELDVWCVSHQVQTAVRLSLCIFRDFSLMQHMGCEPDRASYNIMADAYGRAGLHEGNKMTVEVFVIFVIPTT